MISIVKGIVAEKSPTRVVVDVNGVGYCVSIPISTFNKIGAVGDEVSLLTHLIVREDALQLYGFFTGKEKELFELLISISGIGPKIGLGILSSCNVESLESAIANGDLDTLTAVSGVGKKTAQRIIVELKDKVDASLARGEVVHRKGGPDTEKLEDAVVALVSLGFTRAQALNSVKKSLEGAEQELSLEELVKTALASPSKGG
ncbi:MAG: Holliday junction branch migration protein RuvA [Candidatus Eisenbacteria bacterium]|nr:Holliday junction branch migration protein RuvA [Candidatus Eisenbacteria bacterium]